jgi:hypothetical protein
VRELAAAISVAVGPAEMGLPLWHPIGPDTVLLQACSGPVDSLLFMASTDIGFDASRDVI